MNTPVRRINQWFRSATREEVDWLLSKIILSERQLKIFDMFYIKRNCICFIADTLFISPTVVSEELNEIRYKISVIIS